MNLREAINTLKKHDYIVEAKKEVDYVVLYNIDTDKVYVMKENNKELQNLFDDIKTCKTTNSDFVGTWYQANIVNQEALKEEFTAIRTFDRYYKSKEINVLKNLKIVDLDNSFTRLANVSLDYKNFEEVQTQKVKEWIKENKIYVLYNKFDGDTQGYFVKKGSYVDNLIQNIISKGKTTNMDLTGDWSELELFPLSDNFEITKQKVFDKNLTSKYYPERVLNKYKGEYNKLGRVEFIAPKIYFH